VTARLLEVKPVGQSLYADFVYRIRRVVKGRPVLRRGRRLKVRSFGGDSICGLPRHGRRTIGLFLDRDDGRWHSNLCSTIPAKQMRRLLPAWAAAAGLRGEHSAPMRCKSFPSL
jgi:hypothetical protein